jgi:hypothetical protein
MDQAFRLTRGTCQQAVLAYLMTAEALGSEEALAALRDVHPRANPNPGFVQQLALFASMKNRLDEGNWEYRQRCVLDQWRKSGVDAAELPEPCSTANATDVPPAHPDLICFCV